MTMSVANLTFALLLFVTLSAVVEKSEAWWSGRRSSSSSESSGSGGNWFRRGIDNTRRKIDYASDYAKGTGAMLKAYYDMRKSNWRDSDKYFHARGNADAAKYGEGGKAAANYFSNARESFGRWKGDSEADIAADQEANLHGRNGGDPNKYRPKGLPDKYKK